MQNDLANVLTALTEKSDTKPVERPAQRGAAARVVAAATPPGTTKGPSGGGIASPVTEIDTSGREYWSAGWQTTDGLFVFPAIKTVVMSDDAGNPVEFRFANPAE